MAPVGLKHWMLHNDQLAKEYDEALKLSPDYDPVRDVDPALTFDAPLLTGPDSIVDAVQAVVQRNSEAQYQAPRGAFLLSAPENILRHEYTPNDQPLGVLMEQASTNKCENYTDNPDAALSGLVFGGDPSATMARVRDVEALQAAGLSRICDSGYVVLLDNSAGTTAAYVLIDGQAGNTNAHQCSAYWRGAGNGRIQTTGPTGPAVPIPSIYERYVSEQIPSAGTNRLMIQAEAGAILYFILNEYEESAVRTSPIISRGAATSRAIDQLSWPLGSIINNAEGMGAVVVRFNYAKSATPVNSHRNLVGLEPINSSWVCEIHGSNGTTYIELSDKNALANVTLNNNNGPEPNVDYVIAWRWSSTMRIGYKRAGAWLWGNNPGYRGNFDTDGTLRFSFNSQLPRHGRHLRIWNVDRGESWLEEFHKGIAE